MNATQMADYYQIAVDKIGPDKASLPSGEADAAKAATGKVAASVGDAYLSYANYAKAASMFELAKQKGGVDMDETNLRLGIAKTLGGDAAGAKAAFEAVQTGARKQVADLWLTYLASKGA